MSFIIIAIAIVVVVLVIILLSYLKFIKKSPKSLYNSETLSPTNVPIQNIDEKMNFANEEFNKKNYQKSLLLIDEILNSDPSNANAYIVKGKSYFYLIGFPKNLAESITNLNLDNPSHFGFLSNNFFYENDKTYNYLVEARKCFIKSQTLDIEKREESSKFISEIDEWLEIYKSYNN